MREPRPSYYEGYQKRCVEAELARPAAWFPANQTKPNVSKKLKALEGTVCAAFSRKFKGFIKKLKPFTGGKSDFKTDAEWTRFSLFFNGFRRRRLTLYNC